MVKKANRQTNASAVAEAVSGRTFSGVGRAPQKRLCDIFGGPSDIHPPKTAIPCRFQKVEKTDWRQVLCIINSAV